ncbi:DUF7344 domain-containing protein [Halorussus amylolyticus]|uniref:DUF7344 domain-containing protein n=1 Tax=Halorussus amylolyticus TaxID=1126242 RepID=UPI001043743E|nr:helix-turn-helix domain-containing protein [Halorussus amylolyticus]
MTERILANEPAADVSATFDLLANARRRGVLYAVGRDGAATVADLAERIAAWQGDEEGPSPEAVHTSLVHAHLPKLEDAGAVEYDRERDVVTLTPRAADLEPYLRHTSERESSPPAGADVSRANV